MSQMRLVIVGAGGRMGRTLIRAVAEAPDLALAGAVEPAGSALVGEDAGVLAGLPPLGVTVTDDALPLFAGAEGVIDFTVPAASTVFAALAAQARIVHVIGTTGFSPTGPLGADGLPLASKDSFIFDDRLSKRAPLTRIEDFDVKADTLTLSKSIFRKITKKGDLSKSAFYTGSQAHDANDRIVYNKKTGILSYDVDGSGAKQAIEFAQVKKGMGLTYKDFFII